MCSRLNHILSLLKSVCSLFLLAFFEVRLLDPEIGRLPHTRALNPARLEKSFSFVGACVPEWEEGCGGEKVGFCSQVAPWAKIRSVNLTKQIDSKTQSYVNGDSEQGILKKRRIFRMKRVCIIVKVIYDNVLRKEEKMQGERRQRFSSNLAFIFV